MTRLQSRVDSLDEQPLVSLLRFQLVASAKGAKVYVVNGNKVALRNIKTGTVTTLQVQVLEGLQAGDRVVTSGQLNLEDGSAISINQ